MTEAADAVTDYWFNTLKFPVLRVPKAAANIASRRVSLEGQEGLTAFLHKRKPSWTKLR